MKPDQKRAKTDVEKLVAGKLQWSMVAGETFRLAAWFDDGSLSESDLLQFLSDTELMQAQKRVDPAEYRHLVVRRFFQRLFLSEVANYHGELRGLRLNHAVDTRPSCAEVPDLCLSFTSSGAMFLAAAAPQPIGIDIERWRDVENVEALAKRFFSPEEARHIAHLPLVERSAAFLRHWTAKEAGLKAIGKGIVSGLNTFTLRMDDATGRLALCGPQDGPATVVLQHLDFLPDHCVAVVQDLPLV